MQKVTYQTHLTKDSRKAFDLLMSTAKICIERGSRVLGLTMCKIVGPIFYWKLDEAGYLAIDTSNGFLYCVDDNLYPVETIYSALLDEMKDIEKSLYFILGRSVEAPTKPMVNERFYFLREKLLSISKEFIQAVEKGCIILHDSRVLDGKIFFHYDEDKYVVIWPDGPQNGSHFILVSPDLDFSHAVEESVSFAFYRFLITILQEKLNEVK